MNGISTILIDTSVIFRECLGDHLSKRGFLVTVMSSSADEIDGECLSTVGPQLIIIGVKDNNDWLEKNIKSLRARFHEAQIVVLADQYSLDLVQTAFRYSARGYLMKSIDCSTLIKSLELVMLGELELVMHGPGMFHSAISTRSRRDEDEDIAAADEAPVEPMDLPHASRTLSTRETQILRCLVEGQSNKVIARNLDIVEATVKVHIKSILRKIRVQNRTQAAIWAVNRLNPASSPRSAPHHAEAAQAAF